MNAAEYPIVRYPLAWRHSIVTPTLASLSARLPLPQTCLMAIFPGSYCLIRFRWSLAGPLWLRCTLDTVGKPSSCGITHHTQKHRVCHWSLSGGWADGRAPSLALGPLCPPPSSFWMTWSVCSHCQPPSSIYSPIPSFVRRYSSSEMEVHTNWYMIIYKRRIIICSLVQSPLHHVHALTTPYTLTLPWRQMAWLYSDQISYKFLRFCCFSPSL